MRERFGPGDRKFVFGCLALALVCGTIAFRWFTRAFPEASIQFTVNRSQSQDVAQHFLDAIGLPTGGQKHAATFDYDDETKTFLERKLGLERAQQVYGKSVRLWRWNHRWFIPHEKEELHVEVATGGGIAGFEHLLPEDAPGAELEPDSARAIGERFLTTHLNIRLAEYEFVDGSSTHQPHRVDHTFTWKKRDLDLGDHDATYRMSVTVAGDQASGYAEFLDVPQAWQDDYARLRARNETSALVATLFLLLTVLAMIGSLVLRVRDHDVRWRTVLTFGIVAMALQLLSVLNQFDLEKFDYQTQDSYASFVTQFVMQAILGALAYGGIIVLFTAAAEPIYRERYPNKISLGGFFSRRGVRTKQFFKEVLLGLTLMLFFAAYQSIFYVLAAKQGAWAPLEVPYSNLLNTAIPWALVLFIGFFPAVSEEFISRMFTIPFLDKYLGRAGMPRRLATIAAALIASYVWGFAHSNYPNQPFWIRGVEVGTAGIIVSFVMLRWGILATLVWHYTVDAFYTSMLMLRSENAYFVISGSVTAGIMLVPLVAALVLYWKHGGFEPAVGILNADDSAPPPATPAARIEVVRPDSSYAAVSQRRWWIGVGIAGVLLLLYLVPAVQPGQGIEVVSERRAVEAAAAGHLRLLGGDPARYRVAMQVASRYEPSVGSYVLERTSLQRLNALYLGVLRTPVWRVRFYRPDEREEWIFNLPVNEVAPAATGARQGVEAPVVPLWAFEHIVPDSALGDTLGSDAARSIATDFLRGRGIEAADMELKEASSERQSARIDHTFEWQIPDSTLGDAGVRFVVIVRGASVAGLRPYMHLPEAWLRAYEEQSVLQRVLWVLSRGLVSLLVLALGLLFVMQVRARRFLWGKGLQWGAVAAGLSLVVTALQWKSDIVMRYQTNMPYSLFRIGGIVSVVIQVILVGLLAAVVVGTAFGLRPQARGLFQRGHDRRWVRDGFMLGALGILLLLGVRRLDVVVTWLGARHAPIDELFDFPFAARPLPWLGIFAGQMRSAILTLPVIALVVHGIGRYIGIRRALGLGGIAVVLFAAEGARSLPEFGLGLMTAAIAFAALVFVWGFLFRDNDLAYVVAIVGGRGLGALVKWVSQPAPGALQTGLLVGGLVAIVLVAVAWSAARRRERPTF